MPGQVLDIEVPDGRLEVEVAPVEMRLGRGARGPVAVPSEQLPRLSTELVSETLERVRR